jgi:hypothetical protein
MEFVHNKYYLERQQKTTVELAKCQEVSAEKLTHTETTVTEMTEKASVNSYNTHRYLCHSLQTHIHLRPCVH